MGNENPFEPGDEVEFLDDKIRGKVVDIGDNQEVYVEIEKDWIIPVAAINLVKVPSTLEKLKYLANLYAENTPLPNVIKIKEPKEIIDLHIEKICPNHKRMTDNEKFTFQLEYFKTTLCKAIALSYPRIIFIHGIGKQVLRKAIEYYLIKNNIRNFGPADKRKYGEGAVEVRLMY
jgi:hypothetical protein